MTVAIVSNSGHPRHTAGGRGSKVHVPRPRQQQVRTKLLRTEWWTCPQPRPDSMLHYQLLAACTGRVRSAWLYMSQDESCGWEDVPEVTASFQRVIGDNTSHLLVSELTCYPNINKFFQFWSLAKTSAHLPLSSAEKTCPPFLVSPPGS